MTLGRARSHREVCGFRRPWRWLAEPLLRRWLEGDTDDRVALAEPVLEPVGPRSAARR